MFWRGDTAAMDKYDADKKERMAKAAAKKKALAEKGAVDSKATAEGRVKDVCLQARLVNTVPFRPVLD